MSEQEVPEEARRNYRTPYTDKRKIPTISKYREEQEHRQERAKAFEDRRATIDEEQDDSPQNDRLGAHGQGDSGQEEISPRGEEHDAGAGAGAGREGDDAPKDTSEASAAATDPRQRRKEHHRKRDEAAEREVTDPVTHLPVRIRDYTDDALKEVPENAEHYGSTARTATGLSAKGKKEGELEEELRELRRERARMQALFPPPEFEAVREELVGVQKTGITAGAVGVAVVAVAVMVLERVLGAGLLGRYAPEGMSGSVLSAVKWLMLGGVGAGAVVALVFGIRDWMGKKLDAVWDDEVWEANRVDQSKSSENRDAESVVWLNSLLAAVWPLVNPDLFTSLADTLEDGESEEFPWRILLWRRGSLTLRTQSCRPRSPNSSVWSVWRTSVKGVRAFRYSA